METDQSRTRMKPEENNFCTADRTATGRTLRNRSKIRATRERIPQKRQALQDMARPLKHWLIKHRHNPYPTKTEKIDLALGSRMTLVQVSNWFANARRRLKNTVREANASWAKRIQLYNSNVVGNAELLSIHSEDSIWNSAEETEPVGTTCLSITATATATATATDDHSYSVPDSCCVLGKRPHGCSTPEVSAKRRRCQDNDSGRESPDSSTFLKEAVDDGIAATGCLSHKYKTHILQRYLHDVCTTNTNQDSRVESSTSNNHQVQVEEERRQRRRKNPNPKPTPGHPLRNAQLVTQADQMQATKRKHRPQPPTGRYLKELDAAMALATLARVARSSSMATVHPDHRFVPV